MDLLLRIYFFVFGLLVGSFLNVVIIRLPKNEDLVFRRSACPSCNAGLKWYHNIPLLSFLLLRGRCNFCGVKISWQYPLIELLIGAFSLWLSPDILTTQNLGHYLFYFIMICVFTCHFIIDIRYHLLLDKLNLYLIAVILPFAIIYYHWSHWLLGGILGFGAPLTVTWLFYKLRNQVGLGGGDIKLFGILGILLGPMGIMYTIFLSCFLGAVVGLALIASKKLSKDQPIAFGPAIILIAIFQIYFPELFNSLIQVSMQH